MSHMVVKTKPCCCAPPTTWSLKRLTEPIVVAWLLAVCFSGSLIRRRKTEWAPRPVAVLLLLLDQRLRDRIKWFPLLHWELLLPLCTAPAPSQDYYFWQCLPQEGTFADLMGPGPLYTAFCMAPCHQLHRGGAKEVRDVCKVKTRLSPFMGSWVHHTGFKHWTQIRLICMFEVKGLTEAAGCDPSCSSLCILFMFYNFNKSTNILCTH